MAKQNWYWAQECDYKKKISPENAISPIFPTKKQYTDWRREAKKNGLKNFMNCADHMNMHDL